MDKVNGHYFLFSVTSSQAVVNYAHKHAASNNSATSDNEEEDSDVSSQVISTKQVLINEEKTAEEERKTRWKWNSEKVSSLIHCLFEYKTRKDFEGKDMESDLIKLYEDIRKEMAKMYPEEDFGPEEISECPEGANDQEKVLLQEMISQQKKSIKAGYGRIKCRVKMIRQNFKKAIVEGTRSGSGKLIMENWEQLVFIWGGCPSVNRIEGAVMSLEPDGIFDEGSDFEDYIAEAETSSKDNSTENSDTDVSAYPKKRMPHKQTDVTVDQPPQKTAKLVDNKRSKMEKPLSAQQRDQVMVRIAKEELELKKKNAEILSQTAQGMEKMVETMAQSLNSLGQQLGNGLMLLAQAMGNNQQYPPQTSYFQHFNQYGQRAQEYGANSTSYINMLNNPPASFQPERNSPHLD